MELRCIYVFFKALLYSKVCQVGGATEEAAKRSLRCPIIHAQM